MAPTVVQQSVDGLGWESRSLGHAACGTASGGGKLAAHLPGGEEREESPEDGGLPDAGAAGDDENAMTQCSEDCFALAGGEGLACAGFDGSEGGAGVDVGVGRSSLGGAEQAMRDGVLGVTQVGKEEEVGFVDAFADEVPGAEASFDAAEDEGGIHDEESGGLVAQDVEGKGAVALVGGLKEDVLEAGVDACGGIEREAEALGDLVGGLESDAADVAGEAVRIGADDLDGLVAVGLVDADGAGGGDAVAVEEDHDLADGLLLIPRLLDALAALGADAVNFLEPGGGVLDDFEDPGSEAGDELSGVGRTDTLHEPGGEVSFDALGAVGRGDVEDVGLELASELTVLNPVPAGVDPFAGRHGRGAADDGDDVGVSADADLEDAESVLLVEERDPFDEPGEGIAGRGRRGEGEVQCAN